MRPRGLFLAGMMRFAVVRMIVADLVLTVALHVAVLVTMLAARIVLRLFGLRRLGLRDARFGRRRGRGRASRRGRRASDHASKHDRARNNQGGVSHAARAFLLIRHSSVPHGIQVSQPKMSGTILQGELSSQLSDLSSQF